MNDLREPPTTVKEIGVHLFYLNKNVDELSKLVKQLQSGFVTKEEFDDFKDVVNSKFTETKRRTWVQNTLSAIAGVVLTLLVTNWFNK